VNPPLHHAIWRRKAAAARKTNNPRTRQLVVVSFGMGSPSKHWSFPRRRESTPSAAHFQWLTQWIPAFAGMTAHTSARVSQMTPLPRASSSWSKLGHLAWVHKGYSQLVLGKLPGIIPAPSFTLVDVFTFSEAAVYK